MFQLASIGSRNCGPSGAVSRRLKYSVNKFHAFNPVGNAGNEQRFGIRRTLFNLRRYLFGEVCVELSEGFQISFGMPARNTGCVSGGASGAGAATSNYPTRFSKGCKDQLVRIFLPPLDSGFFAVDSQAEIVLVSRRNL